MCTLTPSGWGEGTLLSGEGKGAKDLSFPFGGRGRGWFHIHNYLTNCFLFRLRYRNYQLANSFQPKL